MIRRAVVVLAAVSVACFPTTTRPPFGPLEAAPQAELQLPVPQATRETALALHADSVPVARTEPKDGWLESDWFDAATMQPTTARHLGPEVVKVRAFVGPSRPNFSLVRIEAVYIPMADPSREERSLERQVADSSAVGRRIAAVLAHMTAEFGDSAARAAALPAAAVAPPAGGHD